MTWIEPAVPDPAQGTKEHPYVYGVTLHALSARMQTPSRWTIEPQAGASLPPEGGSQDARRGRFDAVTGGSFDSASCTVRGRASPAGSYEIFLEARIEGLDLLGIVTAERLVLRLRSFHALRGEAGRDPFLDVPFSLSGSAISGLSVLGKPVPLPPQDCAFSPAGTRLPLEGLGHLHLGEIRHAPGSRRVNLLRLSLHGRAEGELFAAASEVTAGVVEAAG